MRRPLSAELSADDRSLARRWVIGTASVYWTIAFVLFGAALASSTAERATVTARSAQAALVQNQMSPRPYGSLPNIAQATTVCASSQPCKANAAGRLN
jgi:hypothetical protein